ncbi:universal stress protein [Hyunsoonleella flava]|uniref:Universal stress protein n=1 Tax=Hyunsoonleella flava TaxID=2527939 RepID=A0A4Q9FE89_9FLAO|nr:universal stress protein [Hyunsoonleella flava]TBN04308.1 universal stress protein [Hyunsoonleella flava]
MKTILYATDCTVNDASSLKYAYRFSSIMKADLHVLHVYEFPPISYLTIQHPDNLKKRMHREQMELLDKYCKTSLKNEFQQRPITTHVVESNSVSNSILRLSKILSPDLIFIGMKDSHSTRGYFSGNIANTLLESIEIPLLIIPNGMMYNTISTIVYATDFEEYDIVSLKKLVEIAKPFSALIEVIHVYKTNEEAPVKLLMEQFKDRVRKELSYPEIAFKTIASSKIKSGLLSILNRENANVLAMLERTHDWNLANLFHKDLVKDMESEISIPLLVFNKHSMSIENPVFSIDDGVMAY